MCKVSMSFLRKHSVGTQCGTVGNTALSGPGISVLLYKFVNEIELIDHHCENASMHSFLKDGIYQFPSARLTFKADLVLEGSYRKSFAAYYANCYDGDSIDENFDNDMDIVGEVLMLMVGAAGGSWRYDGVDDNNVAYFESE